MKISLIAAVGWRDGAIGKAGRLPWPYIKEDMQRFIEITKAAGVVICGRNTFESLNSKPLPGRKMFVLTSDALRMRKTYDYEEVRFVHDIRETWHWLPWECPQEVVVIGGAQIYKSFLDRDVVDTQYITLVDAEYTDPDTFFPGGVPRPGNGWKIYKSETAKATNGLRFMTLLRDRTTEEVLSGN